MPLKIWIVLFTFLAVLALTEAKGLASGAACTEDSQCQEFYECKEKDGALTCNHKAIFPNPDSKELGGMYLSIIANALINAAGIGAGALFVPYLTLLNNYTPNLAVSYTYPLVFAGGLGTVLSVIAKRHPETKRPLVNYNIVILCVPMLLAGVPIGVLVKKAMAPLLINLLLFLVNFFSLFKTFKNYRKNSKKEKEMFAKEKAEKAKVKGTAQTEEALQSPQTVENSPETQLVQVISHKDEVNKGEKIGSQNAITDKTSEGKEKSDKDTVKAEADQEKIEINLVERVESAASTNNYLERPAGDNSYVNDEMYELGVNTFHLLFVADPEKVIAQARENERRLTIERQERKKAEELKREEEAIAQGIPPELIAQEKLQEEERRKKIVEELEKNEHRLIHWEKVAISFFSLVVIVVLNLIAGNGVFKSIVDIEFCSGGYWGIFVLQILIEIGIYFFSMYIVLKNQKKKDAVDWVYRPEDMRFTRNKLIIIFIVGIIAGILGGILAIGGAMIYSPFLLEFGMPPQPLAASVGWFLVATQFSTMFLGILQGYFTAGDLIFILAMAFFFSFLSSGFVNWVVKKTRRQSVILLNLMIIVFISFIVNIASTSVGMQDDKTFMTTFHAICH
mgnify:CR=1 FL=1